MNKDINLVIEETKAELLNFVNNKLQVLHFLHFVF